MKLTDKQIKQITDIVNENLANHYNIDFHEIDFMALEKTLAKTNFTDDNTKKSYKCTQCKHNCTLKLDQQFTKDEIEHGFPEQFPMGCPFFCYTRLKPNGKEFEIHDEEDWKLNT